MHLMGCFISEHTDSFQFREVQNYDWTSIEWLRDEFEGVDVDCMGPNYRVMLF